MNKKGLIYDMDGNQMGDCNDDLETTWGQKDAMIKEFTMTEKLTRPLPLLHPQEHAEAQILDKEMKQPRGHTTVGFEPDYDEPAKDDSEYSEDDLKHNSMSEGDMNDRVTMGSDFNLSKVFPPGKFGPVGEKDTTKAPNLK